MRYIQLEKEEYGRMCHAIQTLYGSDIPKSDFLLYDKWFYEYTYNKGLHKILCVRRIEIEGNEEVIANTMRVAAKRRNKE